MADAGDTQGERIVLHPGDHRVAASPAVLSTLLGSCVAVCLYDSLRQILGMNHFLLANRRYAMNTPVLASEAGRYGIHAMELLINGMLARGASRERLRAKAFGGGNVLGHPCSSSDNFMCVGAVNVRFVQTFLANDKIPLVAADLGGNFGRQIYFSGTDFSVYVRKIENTQSVHLAEAERLYWRQAVEDNDQRQRQAEFW